MCDWISYTFWVSEREHFGCVVLWIGLGWWAGVGFFLIEIVVTFWHLFAAALIEVTVVFKSTVLPQWR